MKFLFVNSKSSDYLEDMLFSGLVARFGSESVIPYPANIHYYASRYSYPRNLGEAKSLWLYPVDAARRKRMIKQHDFDAVIIGSTKKDTFKNFLKLVDILPAGIPIIYIDGGDYAEVGGDSERLGFKSVYDYVIANHSPTLIFKREKLLSKQYATNVFPLPMAFFKQNLMLSDSKYDVTLWCVESDPIRTKALELIENKYDCRQNGTTRNQIFKNYKRKGLRYLTELSASRIALNFRGVGWDTLRYWEIPAVGVLMISQFPQIEIHDNFVNNEHVVFCDDNLKKLVPAIDYFLSHEDERIDIASRAHAHALEYHTHLNRVDYFFDVVSSYL